MVQQYRRMASVVAIAMLTPHALAGSVSAQAVPERTLDTPRLTIGVTDGSPEYLLFGALQAVRTTGGHIVVANMGTQQIRQYDSSGRHVRTVGRPGEGPGEFRMLQRIGLLVGDSVAAYDIGLGRITVFDPDGAVSRMATVEPFGNTVLPRSWGFTRQGGMLVSTDFDRVFRSGSSRDTVHFAVTSPAGVPVDTLGRYAGEETFVLAVPDFATRRTVAFGRDVFATARGDRLVIGTNDDFSFDVFFAGGRTRRTYRYEQPARRVTRAEVDRANAEWLDAQNERFRQLLAPRIGDFPHAETWPAYGGLVADTDGRVWVQHYSQQTSGGTAWTVFGADGMARLTVRSRQPMRVVDAGADWVLCWSRDEMGVERILLFDL
ncbi:MAG TPA: 6-bladed beta-propeller [Longimicrobiales bacterium]|nr:6-bladed beta-propeller [Longimicrobiales bacterium]